MAKKREVSPRQVKRALKIVYACQTKSDIFNEMVEKRGFRKAYLDVIDQTHPYKPFLTKSISSVDVIGTVEDLVTFAIDELPGEASWPVYEWTKADWLHVFPPHLVEELIRLAVKRNPVRKDRY